MSNQPHHLVAVLPCNDIDASEAFYAQLGFGRAGHADENYRILADGKGAVLHLTRAVEGWLLPGKSPFGLYLYVDDVDGLAARFQERPVAPPASLLHPPKDQPWGMYEFALSDPDEHLVRVGRPSRAGAAQ